MVSVWEKHKYNASWVKKNINIEQIDFMNQDVSIIDETDLNDLDLLNAVELLSDTAAASLSEPETRSDSSRFVPHIPFDVFRAATELWHKKWKTTNDLNLFQNYFVSQNESRFPQFIPPVELSEYISGFQLSVLEKMLKNLKRHLSNLSCRLWTGI